MSDSSRDLAGAAPLTIGVLLFACGAVWRLFGARSLVLEACSSPSPSCGASLAIQQFFESSYSPGARASF